MVQYGKLQRVSFAHYGSSRFSTAPMFTYKFELKIATFFLEHAVNSAISMVKDLRWPTVSGNRELAQLFLGSDFLLCIN